MQLETGRFPPYRDSQIDRERLIIATVAAQRVQKNAPGRLASIVEADQEFGFHLLRHFYPAVRRNAKWNGAMWRQRGFERQKKVFGWTRCSM